MSTRREFLQKIIPTTTIAAAAITQSCATRSHEDRIRDLRLLAQQKNELTVHDLAVSVKATSNGTGSMYSNETVDLFDKIIKSHKANSALFQMNTPRDFSALDGSAKGEMTLLDFAIAVRANPRILNTLIESGAAPSKQTFRKLEVQHGVLKPKRAGYDSQRLMELKERFPTIYAAHERDKESEKGIRKGGVGGPG